MSDNDYRKEGFLEPGKLGREWGFERSRLGKGGGGVAGETCQRLRHVLHLIFLGLSSDSPPAFIPITALVKH